MKGFTRIISLLMTLSLSAVAVSSCYDDTELKESIADLEARVTVLEEKMAANVAAVQSMISVGSIASWDFNAETGKGIITLLDGNTVEINQSIKGYSIITVEKGDDGVYYWAICKDGINLPLTINNKRVPVTVTPALKISKDNEWLISVDGGTTWVNTGISYFTGESSEGGSDAPVTPGDQDAPVVEAQVFEKAERDGDTLVLTLVGGEEIRVQIVGEAVFKAASDTLWFSRALMEKSTTVEMNNVKAYTITEKPEGWKARIEDDMYLFVTAPENFEDYPQQGTVKVLAVFDNGASPEIMCVEVAYEPYLTLAPANGVVMVKMAEHTAEDFTGYILAGWQKDSYTPDAAAAWLNDNSASHVPYEGAATYELESIIEDYSMINEYVVFAAPYLPATQVAQGKIRYEVSDLVSVTTVAVSDTWTVLDLRFDSARLLSVMPVPEFYGGFSEAGRWDAQDRDNMLDILIQGGGMTCTTVKYDGPANGFPDGVEDIKVLLPATEYVLWYAPVKDSDTYEAADFVEYRFTTPDITADASVQTPTYEITEVTSSGLTAEITPAGSYYKTYAAVVNALVIAEMSEKDIISHLIHINTYSEGNAVNTVSTASFSPEDQIYLLAVSLNEDGGYSALLKEPVELEPLVFTEELGVTVTGHECDEVGAITLALEFTGSPVEMTYMAAAFTFFTPETIQQFMALGQMGDASTVKVSSITDGKLLLEGLQTGTLYTFYAVVKDAEGRFSYISSYEFTPVISIDYVMSDDPDYKFGMPKISGNLSSKVFKMTVNMPDECKKYWLFCGDPEYFIGDVFADSDKMVNMELELLGETVHTESTTITYSNVQSYSRIYMVWQDINDRYHAIYEINPNSK